MIGLKCVILILGDKLMEEEGISLSEIFKIIWQKKILVALVTGVGAITLLCLILFVYNPWKVSYETDVEYDWYGIENNTYIGGEKLNYLDFISLDVLKDTQSSSPAFSKIDVEAMVENNDITIAKKEDQYHLVIKGNYFPDSTTAKAFMKAVSEEPYRKNMQYISDIQAGTNLTAYNNAIKISSKLNYLELQMMVLIEGYQKLISFYGDSYVQDKLLSDYLAEVEVYELNYPIFELRYLTVENAYMTPQEYASSVQEKSALLTELNLLNTRKNMLLKSITDIYASSNNSAYIDTALTNYLETMHEVDLRIANVSENLLFINNALEGGYNENQSAAFMKQLGLYVDQISKLTEDYTACVQSILRQNTFIHYQNSSIVKINGKISVLIATAFSLIVSGCLGVGVGFLAGYPKYRKEKLEEEVKER